MSDMKPIRKELRCCEGTVKQQIGKDNFVMWQFDNSFQTPVPLKVQHFGQFCWPFSGNVSLLVDIKILVVLEVVVKKMLQCKALVDQMKNGIYSDHMQLEHS